MFGSSPLIAGSSLLAGSLTDPLRAEAPQKEHFLGWLGNLQEQSGSVISSPDQALDVMDFEPAARNAMPPAHWGYLSTGVDDDATVRANRYGYSHIQIRSRRLVDVTKIDMSRTIFGLRWDSPIVLSPVSAQKAFHPDGELGVARAAKARRQSALEGLTPGDSGLLARPALKRSWKSIDANCAPSCARQERPRSTKLRARAL